GYISSCIITCSLTHGAGTLQPLDILNSEETNAFTKPPFLKIFPFCTMAFPQTQCEFE
ncbi:hypothetical protein NPIL_441881, partial [Nephila pilipes]